MACGAAGEPGGAPGEEEGQGLLPATASSDSLAGMAPKLAGLTSLAGRAWGRMVSFSPQVWAQAQMLRHEKVHAACCIQETQHRIVMP